MYTERGDDCTQSRELRSDAMRRTVNNRVRDSDISRVGQEYGAECRMQDEHLKASKRHDKLHKGWAAWRWIPPGNEDMNDRTRGHMEWTGLLSSRPYRWHIDIRLPCPETFPWGNQHWNSEIWVLLEDCGDT